MVDMAPTPTVHVHQASVDRYVLMTSNTVHQLLVYMEVPVLMDMVPTSCGCAPGYNGTTCSIDIKYCTSATCLNGGTCYDGYGNYTNCTCAPGFNGTTCSNDINYCTPTTCLNGGACYDGYGTFSTCLCTLQWALRWAQ